jgi:MFS family permease
MILAGWAVYGLFCLVMGLNGFHTLLLWPLFAYYGLFLAATEGAEKALVADLAPPDRLGTAYGWFNLTAGVMLVPASLIFGLIYQAAGAQAAFAVSALGALGAVILLPLWALRGGDGGNKAQSRALRKG